jgi:hypothetical protein
MDNFTGSLVECRCFSKGCGKGDGFDMVDVDTFYNHQNLDRVAFADQGR